MIKRLLNLLALPFILLMACQGGPSETEQREKLETEVMALHDEAMAEMGTIYKLRRDLASLRDSLMKSPSADTVVAKLTHEIAQLEIADEAMMSWMRQNKAPADDQPHQEAMRYLQQQQTEMEQVKHLMDSTITAARNTLKKHE